MRVNTTRTRDAAQVETSWHSSQLRLSVRLSCSISSASLRKGLCARSPVRRVMTSPSCARNSGSRKRTQAIDASAKLRRANEAVRDETSLNSSTSIAQGSSHLNYLASQYGCSSGSCHTPCVTTSQLPPNALRYGACRLARLLQPSKSVQHQAVYFEHSANYNAL